MQTETIEYEADGVHMVSSLYRPTGEASGSPLPAILIYPDALGLGEQPAEIGRRLTELGYVALACDLHGNGLFEPSLDAAIGLIGPIRKDPLKIAVRAIGAFDALLAQPGIDPARIAAIGYCIGGTMALELARSGARIAAAISFHGGLKSPKPASPGTVKSRVLVCTGAADPSIDAEQRAGFEDEMTKAGVNWQMSVYGGVKHSFTNPKAGEHKKPDFAAYDEQADRRSWAEMRTVFGEVFGS